MKMQRKYISPETIEVPYMDSLMDLSTASTGANEYIGDELNIFAKENDFGEEEGFENDFWEDERKDFGLEEWTDEW